MFICIYLPEIYTWYLYCDGSQGIGGKTVMSKSLAVHVHGVLDFFNGCEGKSINA